MRSHAKASSAGSSMGRGSRSSSFIRGADATRGPLLAVKGSGALWHARIAAIALPIVSLVLLAAAPAALASKGVVGFIGSTSNGSAEGIFNGPRGVAVNQSGVDATGNSGAAAGDVYIADQGNNRIQQFSAGGTFKRAFGLNVGGAGINVCSSSCLAGTASSEAGSLNQPQGIGIDQAKGLVYVTDQGNRRIDVFAANGAFQGAFGWGALDGSAAFQFCTTICHAPNTSGETEGQAGKFGSQLGYLAVAPSGDVLVADRANRRIDEFTPTVNGSGEVTAMSFDRTWGGGVVDGGAEGTGTVTNGSTSVTSVSTTKKAFVVGQKITGIGIEPGTTIAAVGSTTITLSQAAGPAATGTPTALNVAPGAGNAPQNEIQTVRVVVRVLTGNFKLQFTAPAPQSVASTQTTANIPWNASPAEVQSALEALTNVGVGNVTVTSSNPGGGGKAGGPYTVEFGGVRYADTNVSPLVWVQGSPDIEGGAVTIETAREGAGAAEICAAASGDLCRGGAPGADAGEFGSVGPASLAVDSSGSSYVVDTSNNRVEKFAPGGASPAVFAAGQLSGFSSADISVDRSNGHVLALRKCNATACAPGSYPPPFSTSEYRVLELDSSGNMVDTHAAGSGVTDAMGLAETQSSGKLYVSIEQAGSNGYRGALVLSSPLVKPTAAVDPGSSFVHTGTTATFTGKVDPTGFRASCHFEYSPDDINWVDAGGAMGSGTLTAGSGTITDVSAQIGAFEVGQTLESSDGGITARTTIKAVDPVNRTLTVDSSVNHVETSGPVTLIASPRVSVCGSLAPDAGAQVVSEGVTGLTGSQLYHIRLVATKDFAAGSATSAETTFTTDPGPPLLQRSAVDWPLITTTTAVVEAEINPANQGTTYHVEYVTLGQYEEGGWADASLAPAGLSAIGHTGQAQRLFPKLTGLTPGTEYRARVAATNPSGSVYGDTLGFATYPDQGSLGSCPANERFRSGSSAALPDCRAYEQATPADKNGSDASGEIFHIGASLSGDAVVFQVGAAVPGGVGAEDTPLYVARRGASGWSTRGLLTPPSFGERSQVAGWTPDLELAFDKVQLFGQPGIAQSLVAQDLSTESFQTYYPYTEKAVAKYVAASADDSKVLFMVQGAGVKLTPDAATGKRNLFLFDRETETLSLVGLLPPSEGGGAPVGGSEEAAPGFSQDMHVMSASGDMAFFNNLSNKQVYLRRGLNGPSPETVKVSASQRTVPDPNGTKPATFKMATPSGSLAFFTSCQKLTDDSTAFSTAANSCSTASQGSDLYSYDTETGQLTDLTVDAGDPHGAEVRGVLGASDDGSYVYFVAHGDLDGSGPATPASNCPEVPGKSAGTCNLYLAHNGATTFIARLADGGGFGTSVETAADWEPDSNQRRERTSRVSEDGRTLIFRAMESLTPYDSQGVEEYYRFHVGDPSLVCVTCNPTDAPPVGEPTLSTIQLANITYPSADFLNRIMSTDGNRFFFETPDKLVPADTNGDGGCPEPSGIGQFGRVCQDVYEWELDGNGSCHTAPGCFYLLSGGTSSSNSYFSGASSSGDDVFIFSRERFVPFDHDSLLDVYDVRVGGGLVSQHSESPPPCEAEGCRLAPSGTVPAAGAGTAVFEGPGDPAPKHHGTRGKKHRGKRRHHKRDRWHPRARAARSRRAAR